MTVSNPEIFIGIDPDVKASGFAIWNKKELQLFSYDLFDLLCQLSLYHAKYKVAVKLEAGWLAKGLNWHKGGYGSANAVGRNHEIGRQIEKHCIKHNIKYDLIKPLGYSSWNHNKFCTFTKWPKNKRTNPETRVAGLLVYGY